MQDSEQFMLDVVEMQTGGWFIQDVKRVAGIAFGEFFRQFDALCLTARQGGRVLSEAYVGKTHIEQVSAVSLARHRNVAEEFGGLFDGHLQHFGDVFAFVANLQRLAVVALATLQTSQGT